MKQTNQLYFARITNGNEVKEITLHTNWVTSAMAEGLDYCAKIKRETGIEWRLMSIRTGE